MYSQPAQRTTFTTIIQLPAHGSRTLLQARHAAGWRLNSAPGLEREAVTITSGVNINSVNLELDENNGAGNVAYIDMEKGALLGIPDGNHTLYLKTPPVTIRAYNGSGNCSLYAKLNITTAAGASGTAVVKAFELRVISLAA